MSGTGSTRGIGVLGIGYSWIVIPFDVLHHAIPGLCTSLDVLDGSLLSSLPHMPNQRASPIHPKLSDRVKASLLLPAFSCALHMKSLPSASSRLWGPLITRQLKTGHMHKTRGTWSRPLSPCTSRQPYSQLVFRDKKIFNYLVEALASS